MADVNASAVMHADQQAEIKSSSPNQGTMKAEGKEHSVYPFAETESVSQGVSEFLGDINEPPELPETALSEHAFTEITQETIEVETEIMELLEQLEQPSSEEKGELPKEAKRPSTPSQPQKQGEAKPPQQGQSSQAKLGEQPEVVYSSLFSLAHSFNKGLSDAKKQQQPQNQKQGETREQMKPNQQAAFGQQKGFMSETLMSETHHDKQEQDKDEEGSGGQQQDQQQKEQEQKKLREKFHVKASRSVGRTQASREESAGTTSKSTPNQSLGGVENVYIRFMALMARILGQAEAEAHELYNRIKERTDSIDILTLLVSKINSENGKIDWTKNEEMKELVEKARALGVDIPEGKLKWSEDEKKLLKENIQMRKDSMEKVTQLERTDMQRYLQEASQCHQARSNILKLLKEVMDTIIHNMRP